MRYNFSGNLSAVDKASLENNFWFCDYQYPVKLKREYFLFRLFNLVGKILGVSKLVIFIKINV